MIRWKYCVYCILNFCIPAPIPHVSWPEVRYVTVRDQVNWQVTYTGRESSRAELSGEHTQRA